MDDEQEDEVLYGVFAPALHSLWRYATRTTCSLRDFVMSRHSRSPEVRLIATLVVVLILSSLFLHFKKPLWNGVRSIRGGYARQFLTNTLRNIVFNVESDFNDVFEDGRVGVSAIQGRRGAMEDAFSVMQEVEIFHGKKVSFYGVYDGHGGVVSCLATELHLIN